MDGMQKEQSPPQRPALVTLSSEHDEAYLSVYIPDGALESPLSLRKVGELGTHLRKEWKVVTAASLCGISLTLGLLTFRSSIRNIPESQVNAPAKIEVHAASTPQPGAAPATEETERLKVRNRRLEALVQVLSQHSHQR